MFGKPKKDLGKRPERHHLQFPMGEGALSAEGNVVVVWGLTPCIKTAEKDALLWSDGDREITHVPLPRR